MATTTNFGWTKPTVGGSSGVWGNELNTTLDDIDTDLQAVKDNADDAVLRSTDSTATAVTFLRQPQYQDVNLGTPMSASETIDLDNGRLFHGTHPGSGTVTFSMANVPLSGRLTYFQIEITDGGAGSGISWPAGFPWPGGSPPSLSVSGTDIISVYTRDGGTTFQAILAGQDMQ